MTTISAIYWLAGGLALVGAEILLPGFIIFWFGLAAIAVSVLTAIVPKIIWPYQVAVFAVLTAAFIVGWWRYQKDQPPKHDPSEHLNRHAEAMIGQVITLTDPIKHGQGRSFIHDTLWRIKGADAPKGAQVRITAVDEDSVLAVEYVAGPDPVEAPAGVTAGT
jgi:inner membrane protein